MATATLQPLRGTRCGMPGMTADVWRAQFPNQTAIAQQLLQQATHQWFDMIQLLEGIYKERVYDNPDISDVDLRMHRLTLNGLLHDGENLALINLVLGDQLKQQEEYRQRANEIDAKKADLFKTLIMWHGPIEAQTDIPESFKQAMREVEAGTLEDDDDL